MASKKPKKKKAPKVEDPISIEDFSLDMPDDVKAALKSGDKQAVYNAIFARLTEIRPNNVSTQCPNCNLRLVIPEVESTRCILCGCKELKKQPWSPM